MRFHSAAAFILAKGFGSRNNEFAVNSRNGVNSIPFVPKPLQMLGSDDDMQKANNANLDALRELSSSFKQLAETDLSDVFGSEENGANTPAPTFYSDNVVDEAPAAVAQGVSSSYLDYMSSREAASSSPPTSSLPTTSSSPPTSYSPPQAEAQAGAGAGSSYLDAIAGAKSPPTQSYAPASYAPASSTPATPAAATPGSYMDALNGGAAAASSTPEARPGSYMDSIAGSVSMSQPETPAISYPPAAPQEEPPVVAHVAEVQEEQNLYTEQPAVAHEDPIPQVDVEVFSVDNADAISAGSAPKIETPVPRARTVQLNPGFAPDDDWNPPPVKNPLASPQQPQKVRLGAERVSGYIPNLQGGQGMDVVSHIPKATPKTPVFSKKMSGVHSDFDERAASGLVEAVPTAPANTNNNPFAPQARQQTPMPVFAERVSGIAAADNGGIGNPVSANAPLTPEPKPRVSVAAQRVKDIPDWQTDFEHPAPDVMKPQAPVSVFAKRVNGVPNFNDGAPEQQPKPQPRMSVFSQKVKGVADFSSGPATSVPKPEPPRSVFSQKISSNVPRASVVASSGGDFAAAGNIPVPNPRAALQQQQQQQQEQHYERGYVPVAEMNGTVPGAPKKIPLPDYNQHNQAGNHQDQLTNMDKSFMVSPDDRIGRMQDEYLR